MHGNGASSQFWIHFKDFSKLSTVEGGGERARGIWKLCCVFENNLVWGKRVIRTAKMKPPHNSGSVAVRGFLILHNGKS